MANETSVYLMYFHQLLKLFTSLDVKSESFNRRILSSKFIVLIFFLFSTFNCMHGTDENPAALISKYQDLLFVSIFLFYEVIFIVNKPQICALMAYLEEPFEDFEPNTVQAQLVKDYNREVTLYGKGMLIMFLISSPLLTTMPSVIWLFGATKQDSKECVDLYLGWVKISDLHWYNFSVLFASAVLGLVELGLSLVWYQLLIYTLLKIKFAIKLLRADLEIINETNKWVEENSESDDSDVNSMVWEEDSLICIAPGPSRVQGNEVENKKNTEGKKEDKGLLERIHKEIQKYQRRKEMEREIKLFLGKIVERHVKIIELVKQANETFKLQMMIIVQLGMIAVSMGVPNLKLGKELMNIVYVDRPIEIGGFLVVIGLLCHCGQTLIDESENLRQALYNCDWTDKPYSLRRSLLIMQIVATRPLRLTIGGIYPLGLETYGNMLNATYSYISLIQSLK